MTGMLNKQIASELGVAEKTVKVHRGPRHGEDARGSVAELVRLADGVGESSSRRPNAAATYWTNWTNVQ